MIFCGVLKGHGNAFRGDTTGTDPVLFAAVNTTKFSSTLAPNGYLLLPPPAGGMGQFKGTAYGTTEKLYV